MAVHEDLIKVTEYKVLGKLPDPFLMDDGTRVATAADWEKRREEMYKSVVELQYGTQPPAPEFLEVEKNYDGQMLVYRIYTGTREKPVSFILRLFLPQTDKKCPVVVDGDLCFKYFWDKELRDVFLNNGIAIALFDRTELAHDVMHEGRCKGPLYQTYPEYTFGAIGAWAWGYSRVVDALEKIGLTDMSCVTFSGHSRGAKTAMLAGILDQRAAIVHPNETNAGSCSCYRIHMKAITEDGDERPSERLLDLATNFPFWIGEGMQDYKECEAELPFDSHFTKAMIAPRVLFVAEAASDMWTNPIGTWQTTMAAKEVYKFLGKEENLHWYFRNGYHSYDIEDVRHLVNIIRHVKYGEALLDDYSLTPFKKPELIFDWKAPARAEL